ncbi:MAG: TolC family protein [Mariprofundaceae bacterium]|nr:TolC family protein [Mariprofundaceae bacterium]
MRIPYIITGIFMCLNPWLAQATTLAQAMAQAVAQHPRLQIAEQGIAIARGQLSEQRAYAYNPQLSVEPQRRQLNNGGTANDYYITLSQGIETGGKRNFRTQAAEAAFNAADHEKRATRQHLAINAARSFVDLYYARQRLQLRQQQSQMLHQLSKALQRQLNVGESSQLDANLAHSTYAAALNATLVAQQAFTQNLMRYAAALALPASQASDKLSLPEILLNWHIPDHAYELALESRSDIASLRSRMEQSNAEADLAGARRIPDITLSAMSGREAGEQLVKLGVSVPFLVFNSHQGAYQAALADSERMQNELKWSEQQLSLAVDAAITGHKYAMQALKDIATSDTAAQDTITLARKAYAAGELDLEELVVHIRQGLDARLTVLDTVQQGWMARIRLAEVLGHQEYILQGIQQ